MYIHFYIMNQDILKPRETFVLKGHTMNFTHGEEFNNYVA